LLIYDCILLDGSYEVGNSSLKGIGKVCKGSSGTKQDRLKLRWVEITTES